MNKSIKKVVMKMIPILLCSDMKEAISFYTNILDFQLKYPGTSSDDWVVDLINEDAELMLTSLKGDQKPSINIYIRVNDVDTLYQKYINRGLNTSNKKESPVHQEPLNQTWGMREFYVTDNDGNTLRFGKPIE